MQCDPIRALGESISFGRFLSESLAWEKRSTFSHNPYLEEVEKFSKPGSVAQKKAYFEARYKKKAAERAAALLEEANTIARTVSESESKDKLHDDFFMDSARTVCESESKDELHVDLFMDSARTVSELESKDKLHDDSFMDSALVKADSLKAIDEPHGGDTPVTTVGYSFCSNGANPNVEVLKTAKVDVADAVTQEGVNLVEISDQIQKVEDYQKILAFQKEKKLKKVVGLYLVCRFLICQLCPLLILPIYHFLIYAAGSCLQGDSPFTKQ